MSDDWVKLGLLPSPDADLIFELSGREPGEANVAFTRALYCGLQAAIGIYGRVAGAGPRSIHPQSADWQDVCRVGHAFGCASWELEPAMKLLKACGLVWQLGQQFGLAYPKDQPADALPAWRQRAEFACEMAAEHIQRTGVGWRRKLAA